MPARKKKRSKKASNKKISVESYRHESATRKNIPTAKIAAEGMVPRVAKAKYAYSAHLSPELRFDASGQSDRINDIVEKTTSGYKLTREEANILFGIAANASQPWLEWSGKKEEHDRDVFEVEPVALHIHERVSANAIVRAAKREDVQADLFADPQQEYKEAIQFYRHDVDWANRLILGDSLEVMSSLTEREGLQGQVQTIFVDPPYGIRFGSNFQAAVANKEVKDRDSDLTREPEMIKAYRDTWSLGTHSYLSYLRDRLVVAKSLLNDEGSIFVQISDENLHRVRVLLDEVFGPDNFCSTISFQKTGSMASNLLPTTVDYLLWYAKDKTQVRYRQLYLDRKQGDPSLDRYDKVLMKDGSFRSLVKDEKDGVKETPGERYQLTSLFSDGAASTEQDFYFQGEVYSPKSNAHWKTTVEGLARLARAGRIQKQGDRLRYVRFANDFGVVPLSDRWESVQIGKESVYVVQTASKVVERCILMTTDPGDLVLDPTCGSGTTAYAAEKLGRRWITVDSSRVSISIARQRLLTSSYQHYHVRGENTESTQGTKLGVDPSNNFSYRTIPRVTLGSIAKNEAIDPIVNEYEERLDTCLRKINKAVSLVTSKQRSSLLVSLAEKLQREGLRAVQESEKRGALLPGTSRSQLKEAFSGKSKIKRHHIEDYFSRVPANNIFEHWQVPFSINHEWPQLLSESITKYREIWFQMKTDLNNCIAENAEQIEIFDQPAIASGVIRVAGPFTVEGVRPEELSLDKNGELFDPTPNEFEVNDEQGSYAQNASAYLDRMLQLIRQDGVTFPNNEHRKFSFVERLEESDSALHAEALWEGAGDGDLPNVAIAFGPQHGPVTASQVEDLIRASRRYDELVIAAFSFDGSSQAVIQESANPRLKIHLAHIRPDVSPGMDGLLKDSPKNQLFTVFGQPEIKLHEEDGEFKVELLGVDIYSPLTGEITSSGANKVAAWFLDSDYDGRCFCITQAFFPNQKAWDKIAKALGSSADVEAFEAFNGTVSVPFESGEHRRIAVKVIDPRGNEVMAIRSLKDAN